MMSVNSNPSQSNPEVRSTVPVLHYLQSVSLEAGGVVRAVLDLCRVMASYGHPITLLTADGRDVPEEWLGGGSPTLPRVVRVPGPLGPGGRMSSTALQTVRDQLARHDVAHLHGMWEVGNWQVAREARVAGKPYVVTAHGMLDDWSMSQSKLKKRLAMWLAARTYLARAGRVHLTAEMEAQQAKKWVGGARCEILPYILDLVPFTPAPTPDLARASIPVFAGPEPVVLFLSRLHPKKGLEVLLDASAILVRDGTPHHIAIAGTGDDDYVTGLKQRVQSLGLSRHVSFLGMVKGELKLSVYAASRVMVVPTSQENFGLVFPEAMACGTPVITTRGVDIWKELERGGATIVDATPQVIADAIRAALADPQRTAETGRRGREWVLSDLAETRVVSGYEAMYRAVVAGR